MISRTNGRPISITGLGCHVPERVVTNDELAKIVDTTDEWIRDRTGIRERRIAADTEAMSDLALPACRRALEMAGVEANSIDLLIVATVTPDMAFPATAAIARGRARDAGRCRLRPLGRLHRLHVRDRAGLRDARAPAWHGGRSWSAATCSRGCSTGPIARRSSSSATAPARSCSSRSSSGGFLGFELGADGAGGRELLSARERLAALRTAPPSVLKMNGREVFKFATRVMVSSAEAILDECGKTVDDVDVYVPHQANVRIIDHAARKLGIPEEKVVVNVDRYGNTSSGSIPLALADAADDGRLEPGKLVLMTGMGAGLTWGSALIEWTHPTNGATA